MPECVWHASLLIWHIVCSLWFTAQPGNVRQEQAPATEGKTEKNMVCECQDCEFVCAVH